MGPPGGSVLCAWLVAIVATCGQACTTSDHRLSFSVDFANPALRSRAVLVEATLRKGGCSGALVFETQIERGEQGAAPPSLAPGRYGFAARARDESCSWFAAGCTEANLPSSSALTVVLSASEAQVVDTKCTPAGVDGDSGISHDWKDADTRDNNPADASPDASDAQMTLEDAGHDAGSAAGSGLYPTTAKCASIDSDVVACFDFEGTLDDASSYQNHAIGGSPTFEPARSGQGVRVGGTRVKLLDAASIDFTTAFTLEAWLRIDSLTNLANETHGDSLIIDKNDQYTLSFDSYGHLRGEVYNDDVDHTWGPTASDDRIPVKEFVYLAVVYDGTTTRLYQDGQLGTAKEFDYTLRAGTDPLFIGSGSPNVTHPFDGLIDAVRISKRARDDREICAAAGRTFSMGTCP
jgi:hypothetical protein